MSEHERDACEELFARATAKLQLSIAEIYRPRTWRERLGMWIAGEYSYNDRQILIVAAACRVAAFASFPETEQKIWGKFADRFQDMASKERGV